MGGAGAAQAYYYPMPKGGRTLWPLQIECGMRLPQPAGTWSSARTKPQPSSSVPRHPPQVAALYSVMAAKHGVTNFIVQQLAQLLDTLASLQEAAAGKPARQQCSSGQESTAGPIQMPPEPATAQEPAAAGGGAAAGPSDAVSTAREFTFDSPRKASAPASPVAGRAEAAGQPEFSGVKVLQAAIMQQQHQEQQQQQQEQQQQRQMLQQQEQQRGEEAEGGRAAQQGQAGASTAQGSPAAQATQVYHSLQFGSVRLHGR